LDSLRIAREVQADPDLPVAFKRAPGDAGPDETHELLSLWHNQRRSLVKSRQHLLNEADALLHDLPEEIRADFPDSTAIRPRLKALADSPDSTAIRPRLKALADRDRTVTCDPVTALRLRLLDDHTAAIAELDAREREASRELRHLIRRVGSTLSELCGIADRSDAELLVETGDPRRFAGESGFARFNGTAPLPVSSAEGDDEPKRHRLNRGGNRRVNALLHRMAMTQLRCDPRARQIYDDADDTVTPRKKRCGP
jgi:transposase